MITKNDQQILHGFQQMNITDAYRSSVISEWDDIALRLSLEAVCAVCIGQVPKEGSLSAVFQA